MRCDRCDAPAAFTLTAAYPDPEQAWRSHPLFATYPAPMARVCATHLVEEIQRDELAPGATPCYLLRRSA
jgi:hypothetical protein